MVQNNNDNPSPSTYVKQLNNISLKPLVGFNKTYLKPSYYINVIYYIKVIMPNLGNGGAQKTYVYVSPQPPPLDLLVIKTNVNVWLENFTGLILKV